MKYEKVGTVRDDGMILIGYVRNKPWWGTPEQREKRLEQKRVVAKRKLKETLADPVKRARRKKQYTLWTYNLTEEQYDSMLELQNHKCAICGITFGSDNKTRPNVDHCHNSDKVRGFLCFSCNAGIGLLKESETNLQNAISYLRLHPTKVS